MSFLARPLAQRALRTSTAIRNHVAARFQHSATALLTRPSSASMIPSLHSLFSPKTYSMTHLIPSLLDMAIWLMKRTFQPSIIRKKRKTGFLVRQRTVGGRKTLARRMHKGRMRLGGGI